MEDPMQILTGYIDGLEGQLTPVTATRNGSGTFHLHGLVAGAAREARVRARSALIECGHTFAPCVVRVGEDYQDTLQGTGFDLALAVAVHHAETPEAAPAEDVPTLLLAELGLDGSLRGVRGAFAICEAAVEAGVQRAICAPHNQREAAASGIQAYPARNLSQVLAHLDPRDEYTMQPYGGPVESTRKPDRLLWGDLPDELAVHVSEGAAEALERGVPLLLVGSPGSGKTMAARRIPALMGSLSEAEQRDLTRIYSGAGLLGDDGLYPYARPFRAPHHTISELGLIGGGSPSPRPGEFTLAHHGVLYLAELPEFRRTVLEAAIRAHRDGEAQIYRTRKLYRFPGKPLLVGATNPCPCGFKGSSLRRCQCSTESVEHYRKRLEPFRALDPVVIDINDAWMARRREQLLAKYRPSL
jgi:magnesium chelatase family protein